MYIVYKFMQYIILYEYIIYGTINVISMYLHIVQIYRLMVTNTGNVNSTNVKLLHRFQMLLPEYLNLCMSVLCHGNLKKET